MGCARRRKIDARGKGVVVATRERVLRRVVSFVIGLAVLVSVAFLTLTHDSLAGFRAWLLPALIGLVAVASSAVVRVRLRSTVIGTTWVDAAILICIVYLPPAWVPLCVGTGVLVAKLLMRVTPIKAAYNAAKVGLALGVAFAPRPLAHPAELFAVTLAAGVTEYVIGVPVLALASGMRWKRI